jgi:hypothetical protein
MDKENRLDGGYGFEGDMGIIITLENLSLEERKKYCEELQKKDPVAFKEFCEDYSDSLKKLGLEEYI